MVESMAASEAAHQVGAVAPHSVREASGLQEVGEAREAREASEGARTVDLAKVGQIEGWSMEDFGRSSHEILGLGSQETEPLLGSEGQVTDLLRPEEKAHYDAIGLEPERIAGRECLVRDDIDWGQRDAYGQTNLERAEQGLAPQDARGEQFELHHVQQRDDGVLAELTQDEHRNPGLDRILHDKQGPSEIDRKAFAGIRAEHWQERAAQVRGELN